MKLNLQESMEIVDDAEIFFGSNHRKNKEKMLNILEDIPIIAQDSEFLPDNVQNCIEIASSNVISIPENQIVKIQYHNENGTVNTEYIVNDEILQVQGTLEDSDYLLNEDQIIYESPPETIEETSSQEIETSILSPKSDNEETIETDLTSLNWLHNITNIMAVPNLPTPPVSPKPKKKSSNSNQEDLTININFYKKNGEKKPPFSYATLICMAMGKNGNKMTLSAIYHWIRENFLYYRKAHPSWQVSKRKKKNIKL